MEKYINISTNAFINLRESERLKATWDSVEYPLVHDSINSSFSDTYIKLSFTAETGELPFSISAEATRTSTDNPWGNAVVIVSYEEEGSHTFSLIIDYSALKLPTGETAN